MLTSEQFIEKIEQILNYYNLSASLFAEKIGVQRSSLSHLLSGRNKPSLDFVIKIVEEFPEVDLYWFLFNQGSFPKEEKNENPIAFDMTLSYLITLGVFDGKFDALEKAFQSKFTKKVTKNLSSSSIASAKQSAVADNRSTSQILKTHLKKKNNKQ